MAKNINRYLNEITVNRENIRLIYLDKFEPSIEIQTKLFEINPAIQFYTDIQLCIDFLQLNSNEEIFLIISNILLTDIFNSIYSLQSILAIFIYDDKQIINELEFKLKYPKIIDIYTNQNDLFNSIKENILLIEKQIFIYSLFNPKIQNLTHESALFRWYQMLINILKQIPHNEYKRDEILNKCLQYYRMNNYELDTIISFRQSYTAQQAIQWYTKECFLYRFLNRALYIHDIEYLYSFQYFLIDICLEIEKECEIIKNEKYLIVYRAQFMSNDEIEELKKNIGCFISINNFILTTRNKNYSLAFFQQHFTTKENILFEIHIDFSIQTNLLADLSSSLNGEQNILLNINSIFKIDSIEYNTINNLWEIKLITNHDGTKHINEYFKWIENEMNYQNSIIYFGHLLWNNLKEINQGKTYFQILSKSFSNEYIHMSEIYFELGNIYDELKEYSLALNKYQHALKICQKQLTIDHTRIALLLNNIGIVYKHMGNYDRAIEFYGQSLYIYETKCSKNKNQFYRANTISNLGLAYKDKNDYDTALTYLNLAYDIRHDILSKDHLLLANSLNNIGEIYHDKNDLNQALNYYQQALSIQENNNSNDSLDKAITIRNIGLIYRDKQDWQNALNYFNRTLEIRQHCLHNINYPDTAICYGDIGNIYEKMNKLDLALNNFFQQLQIEEHCLPLNHKNLIIHFDLIVNLLKKTDQSNKAMELCQEKLLHLKHILGNDYENHPRIAHIFVLIATIYEDENPKQADQHYQQALTILENKKNEEILQTCLSPMTNFYWKCRMFDRALICQMKLLNIRRSTLSSNHNDIAYTLRGLARLYRAMNKSNEALHYFHQSLNILQSNYGSEHADVKNIQNEIFELKDIIHSVPLNTNEESNINQAAINTHKLLVTSPSNESKFPSSSSSSMNIEKKNQPSPSILKSAFCIII
ncbi:unnamed protein product [Adineta steineri]|uniref:Uncharacterized protein n=1 Tax=Adineta steineri TaxID=433720 RepID=A0A814PJS0_9BILA|nr:unnamed protein product [Adineta steineri]CAF1106880.1 unnamed protein product [Adineta steineri]